MAHARRHAAWDGAFPGRAIKDAVARPSAQQAVIGGHRGDNGACVIINANVPDGQHEVEILIRIDPGRHGQENLDVNQRIARIFAGVFNPARESAQFGVDPGVLAAIAIG